MHAGWQTRLRKVEERARQTRRNGYDVLLLYVRRLVTAHGRCPVEADPAVADNQEKLIFPAGISSRNLSPKLARSKILIDKISVSEQMQALKAAASSKKRKSRDDDEQEDLAAAILESMAGLSVNTSSSSSTSRQEATCLTVSGFIHPKFLSVIQRLAESVWKACQFWARLTRHQQQGQ